MNYNSIPEDIARFVLDKIDSVAQLEALLLLRGNPKKEWDVAAVAKSLYVDDNQAHATLVRLVEESLVVALPREPARYRYEPVAPELQKMVDRLSEIYSKHLVPVTNLIHSKPSTRVREFANAFKFRKDD